MIQTVLIMKPALRDIVRIPVNIQVILADQMLNVQQFFIDLYVNANLDGWVIHIGSVINVSSYVFLLTTI